MYTIESKDDKFVLLKDGLVCGEYVSLEAAEQAEKQQKADDERILKSLEEIDAQGRAGSSETLVEKVFGEARVDALCRFLHNTHGIHVPYEIAPKE